MRYTNVMGNKIGGLLCGVEMGKVFFDESVGVEMGCHGYKPGRRNR